MYMIFLFNCRILYQAAALITEVEWKKGPNKSQIVRHWRIWAAVVESNTASAEVLLLYLNNSLLFYLFHMSEGM